KEQKKEKKGQGGTEREEQRGRRRVCRSGDVGVGWREKKKEKWKKRVGKEKKERKAKKYRKSERR
ncbi:19707_t:CDS:1, partial [Dentiscutata erythropus]